MKKKEYKLIDGYRFWHCSGCKTWKGKEAFYKDKRTSNGLTAHCKKCHTACSIRTRDKINARRLGRESMRRMRQADPEKYRRRDRKAARKRPKNTPARKAYKQLRAALRRGLLRKPKRC